MKDQLKKNPHAVAMGRLGGKSRSAKKIAASRVNAKKKLHKK